MPGYRRLPVFHATQSGTQSRSNHTDEKAARSRACSLNLARYKVITETILTVKEPKQNPTTNRTAAKQRLRPEPIPHRSGNRIRIPTTNKTAAKRRLRAESITCRLGNRIRILTTNRTAAKQHLRPKSITLRPTTTSAQRNTTKSEESLNISNVVSIQHRITAAWPEGRGVGRGNGLRNYECFPSPQNFPALKKQKIILRKKISYKKTH